MAGDVAAATRDTVPLVDAGRDKERGSPCARRRTDVRRMMARRAVLGTTTRPARQGAATGAGTGGAAARKGKGDASGGRWQCGESEGERDETACRGETPTTPCALSGGTGRESTFVAGAHMGRPRSPRANRERRGALSSVDGCTGEYIRCRQGAAIVLFALPQMLLESLFDSLHELLFDSLLDWLLDWLHDWLLDWLLDSLFDWLPDSFDAHVVSARNMSPAATSAALAVGLLFQPACPPPWQTPVAIRLPPAAVPSSPMARWIGPLGTRSPAGE
ncbi:uncharacterized protein BJ171DRAFT_478768 [Polychytrium aggregatum]|uniref:uncharacterized protein n=1 Tax=Polychytrium aggregatum TaxID=110093 RepID=UPI0022FEED29|nr:uncharacterized protein BJ171DRAFT_478768 [Polychytrium aggregatum]KAI9193632.1 hypothetical protein BJ171DRAFT_478768 [Polychytrium aggregatum]